MLKKKLPFFKLLSHFCGGLKEKKGYSTESHSTPPWKRTKIPWSISFLLIVGKTAFDFQL